MNYKIQILDSGRHFDAPHYLAGPRTPDHVRKLGYGFTPEPADAWPFPSAAQAFAKLRIVDRHMGGSLKMGVIQWAARNHKGDNEAINRNPATTD